VRTTVCDVPLARHLQHGQKRGTEPTVQVFFFVKKSNPTLDHSPAEGDPGPGTGHPGPRNRPIPPLSRPPPPLAAGQNPPFIRPQMLPPGAVRQRRSRTVRALGSRVPRSRWGRPDRACPPLWTAAAAAPIPPGMTGTDDLAARLRSGDRRALARAITLVESGRADHRAAALDLLAAVPEPEDCLKIGLSGTPGVGKSTFIEGFGLMLTGQGHRVAVLAVDPSSARSGGSILGDKTRMEHLSRDPAAFIRPSPSQSELGGVARRTREAAHLCAAAGYDVVLIETVGVGQSETQVAHMTDLFLLLLAPAGGDELQGVKRGIMEIADIILVNKADGDLRPQALRTCADYSGALRLLRKRPQDPEGFPKAMCVSAIETTGLETAWQEIRTLHQKRRESGWLARSRAEQAVHWFEEEVRQALLARLRREPVRGLMADLARRVERGEETPAAAARLLIEQMLGPGAPADP